MSLVAAGVAFALSLLFIAVIGTWAMRRHGARTSAAHSNWSTDSGAFLASSDSGASCDSSSDGGGGCDGGGGGD